MLCTINPPEFSSKLMVAGCLVENNRKLLLLKRNISSTQGGKWGLPSGKVKNGETIVDAILRELKEETGITAKKSHIKFIKNYNVRFENENDFIYCLFHLRLNIISDIKLNTREHTDFKWVNFSEVLSLPLVPGVNECVNEILAS